MSADVASFQLPESGESFLAYLKGPKPGQGTTPGTLAAPVIRMPLIELAAGAEVLQAGAAARQFGSDLMLRDLRTAAE